MNDHLNAIHENNRRVNNIVFRLERLAESFENTGNLTVAGKLHEIADDIYSAAKEISESFSKDLDRRLKETQEHSASVLKALLDNAKGDE